jgi:uncharacterized protein YecE (DUF72 family)
MAGEIHVGTSGWSYGHWKGPFYPDRLPAKRFLSHYAGIFRTVEINSSFYGLPEATTFASWRETVPRGFVFALKASRFITHMKRLRGAEAEDALDRFLKRADALEDALGPVLFQTPPRLERDAALLEDFLRLLPSGYMFAFEFRNPSWFDSRVYETLDAHGAAFCIFDLNGRLSPVEVTGRTAYIRLHGPDGPYRGRYGPENLAEWADRIVSWAERGIATYCYFDNTDDPEAYAPQDARMLKDMVESR